MELTIENIIKLILGVFVFVAVVIAVYFSMKYYIIPYFSGLGPSGNQTGDIGGSADVCAGKSSIGRIDNYFFVPDSLNKKIDIYFEQRDNNFLVKRAKGLWFDPEIGRVNGIQIEIYTNELSDDYTQALNMAYIGGNQICK